MDKKIIERIKGDFNLELNKEQLLKMSEIGLWLDTYDDLFSDFDPRPYNERSISVDFLDEIKRASRDKVSGALELKFLIPKDMRKIDIEVHIKKRLRDHFKKHYESLENEKKNITKKGLFIAGCGFASMFLAVLVKSYLTKELLKIALSTLLEPAGWFAMFFGLETAFGSSKEKNAELEFYHKMHAAEISFISY